MFNNAEELLNISKKDKLAIYEIMIEQELEINGGTREVLINKMADNFHVMKAAVKKGIQGLTTQSGLCGHDARRLWEYIQKGNFITDITLLKAACYAIATNEVNASMGVICATPTAGSAGVLPGAIIAIQEKYQIEDEKIILELFTAGAFGYIIANNAFISGAAGGCQAEIGSASAMTAAMICSLLGGSSDQSAHAMALALKNMLGLTCDPLAGLVEVPCIKRNASGAANAILAAEMALAGIESKIPCDEVIEAMKAIGQGMPSVFKETSLGGLATTCTGKAWQLKLWT